MNSSVSQSKKSLWKSSLLTLSLAISYTSQAQTTSSQVSILLQGEQGGRCQVSPTQVSAGPVTFTIVNQSATAINEVELLSDNRILGEKENLAPGLPAVSFSLNLEGGNYQIYCPGAAKALVDFTVTGARHNSVSPPLSQKFKLGTEGYTAYTNNMVDNLLQNAKQLQQAVISGDLKAAQQAYAQTRPFYERIESDVSGFLLPGFKATDNHGNLDYLIDMRASNLDPTVGWHGFHAIERDLFKHSKITVETRQLAQELTKHIQQLAKQVKGLSYKPEDLANGAADLLEEIQNTKINGEEEAYSHIDLVDFAANIEGAEQAFAFLKPGLESLDPVLSSKITEQFTKIHALLDQFKDPQGLGGYQRYTPELKAKKAAQLSRAIQSLQEPLSRIAEKVATHGAQ